MSSPDKIKEEEVELKKDLAFTIPPSTAALVVHLRLEALKTAADVSEEKNDSAPAATPLELALFELRRRGFIVEALSSSEKSDKATVAEHWALLSCSTKLLVRLALLQGFPVQQYENYSSLQRLQLAQAAVDVVLDAKRETHAVDAWAAHDPKLRERLFNTETETDEVSASETTSDAQGAGEGAKKSKKGPKARRPLVRIERSLEAIFAYFGPQLGLYFGFLSYYTQTLGIPAVLGVIVTAHQCLGRDVNSQFLPLFIVVLSLWATWFLQSWKSKCFGYCFSWQTLGLEESEKDKELAKAASKESSSRTLRVLLSLVVTLAIIVFLLRVMLFFVDWNVRAEELYGASWFRYVPLLLYSLFPVVSPLVFEPVAAFLNAFEQHCTRSDAEYHMVLKRFALQFVNRYSALLYATFYRRDMAMLRELLLSLLITGAAINNAQEIALPRVQQWWNKFRNKSVVVVDPSEEKRTNDDNSSSNNNDNKSDSKSDRREGKSVKENKTSLWPMALNAAKAHAIGKNMLARTRAQGLLDSEEAKALLANELSLSSYEEDEDLLELVLQFGFVTMFAAALPLTPLLALVNNVFEARVDLAKLSTLRRPPLRVRSSIGAWQRCLEVLAVLAIVTNCFLLCVASEDALFHGMVRFLLQSLPFSSSLRSLFGAEENGSAHSPAEGESYSLALRVVAMLLLEHALFAVTLLLGQFVEETPRFVREAQARESLLRTENERAKKVAALAAEGVLLDNALDSTANGASLLLSQSSSSSSSLLAMYSASRSPYLFGISDPIQLTALFSAPWLLQSLSLSPLLYLPLSLLYFAQKQTEKERQERQLAIEMVSKDSSLAQLIKETLPGFVKDPDVQRVEWLNSILQRVWRSFSLALDKKLTPEVQKALDTHCPSFLTCLELKKLSLGSTAPRIAGIRVFSSGGAGGSDAYTGTSGSALTLDVELQWLARDLQVSLKVGTAPMPLLVELTEFSFTTSARIELLDLIPALPLFKALSVTILKKPELRFALNIGNTVDVMSLGLNPALSMNALVQRIVHSALSDLLIYPKKLIVPLVQEEDKDQAQRDLERYTRVTVLGELCVMVHSARDLKGANLGGDSDPFVTISSSAMQKPQTTKIKRKTRTAIFEESFNFDVYDLATQMVNFTVLDHNDFAEHVPLGNCSVSLSELVASAKDEFAQSGHEDKAEEVLDNGFSTQRTFVLRDVEQGSLVVSFTYTPADKKEDDHDHHNSNGHKKKAKKSKAPIRFEDYRRDEVFSGDLAHLSSNAPLVKDSVAASESIAAMLHEKRRKEKKALREQQAQQGVAEDDLLLSDSDDDDMSEGAERDTGEEKSSRRRKGAAAQAVTAASMVYSAVKTTTSSAVMSTAKVLGVTSTNSNNNSNTGNDSNNARPPQPPLVKAVSMRPLSLRGRLIISHIKVFNLFAASQSSAGDGRASFSPAKVSLADLRPFVSVTIGQTVQETNYLKNNHHPEYPETLSFHFNVDMINFSQRPSQTNVTPAVVSPSPDARNRNHPECALAGEDPSTTLVYIRVCDRFSRWSFSKIANMQNHRLLAYVSIPLVELMQNIRKNGKIPSTLNVRAQQSAQRSLQAEYTLSGEYADSKLSCKYTWIPDSN